MAAEPLPPASAPQLMRMALELLSPQERVQAAVTLAVMLLAALFGALMVLSVIPFLQILSDPAVIHANPLLERAYRLLGPASEYDFVVLVGVGTVAFILFANLLQMLRLRLETRFAMMRIHSLGLRLLAAYMRQPYEFFLYRHSGDMSKAVLSEAEQLVNDFYRPLAALTGAALSALAITVALVWVNPVIALGGIVLIGGSYGLIYLVMRVQMARLGAARSEVNGARFRIVGEALTGVKNVKLMGREHSYVSVFEEPSRRYAEIQSRAWFLFGAPRYVMQTVLFGGIVLVCLLLMDRSSYEAGTTLGGLLPVIGAFALGGQKLVPEVQEIFGGMSRLRFGTAVLRSVHADTMRARGLPAPPSERPARLGLTQSLAFEDVSYRYPNAEEAGVTGLTLEIARGERIGIVGATGAGKSTLADLVLGLLRPQSGRLLVDGVELTDARLRAWQAGVGYVPQEIFITDSSIAQNIAFGLSEAEIDRARVEACGRMARIDGFVQSDLPEGYDTFVGERGVRLSGGQRQRIGIARALYHDADLIVFDEATSALDTLTEREVMSALDALPGTKTVLMIAHRLSTVKRCDRILVLEQGRIAGFAPWPSLMDNCPPFRRLVDVAEAA